MSNYILVNGCFYEISENTSLNEICHYGVKGMKWGVRRTPKQLGRRRFIHNSRSVVKTVVSGHSPTAKRSKPNSISEHIDRDGKVDVRTFYDNNGLKAKDIHLSNHGNPKQHDSIHVVMYSWNADGSLKHKSSRKLTALEVKENADIL